MPFSPAPLLPGSSPLPAPGQRPPDRRALRAGALTAVPLLLVSLGLGALLLPHILFLTPLLQAQAGSSEQAGGSAFQGFVYPWARGQSGGGYNTPSSLQNMKSEAGLFHMNSVVITVVADMPQRSASALLWHATDANDADTLPEGDYVSAIADARKAGLVPILELQVRQQDSNSGSDQSAYYIGHAWFDQSSDLNYSLGDTSVNVGATERAWFDNYTAFAVHYAQLAAKYRLPYFIVGNQLMPVSYDTANTTRANDPHGVASGPQGCSGRRDCEWRHLALAIRGATYTPLQGGAARPGASYAGKLIYAAGWTIAPNLTGAQIEFESISWWDAMDYIGVDAYFPLTHDTDPLVDTLVSAWHGKGTDQAGQGDIFSRLQKVSDKFNRPIVFSSAGYESAPGSNNDPGQADTSNTDQGEQLNDMQALLQTFTGEAWWLGIFWYADAPVPAASASGWTTSSAWAGATLADSKLAGQYLAGFYKSNPIACSC